MDVANIFDCAVVYVIILVMLLAIEQIKQDGDTIEIVTVGKKIYRGWEEGEGGVGGFRYQTFFCS